MIFSVFLLVLFLKITETSTCKRIYILHVEINQPQFIKKKSNTVCCLLKFWQDLCCTFICIEKKRNFAVNTTYVVSPVTLYFLINYIIKPLCTISKTDLIKSAESECNNAKVLFPNKRLCLSGVCLISQSKNLKIDTFWISLYYQDIRTKKCRVSNCEVTFLKIRFLVIEWFSGDDNLCI